MAAGDRIGIYEITAAIGAGGMGEVYRARDTRLGRDVALKILPEVFASDPERLARFEREAQVLASLNHPHIAAIHGIEESNGIRALVLEFVDGETLADRIARGPIPLEEALPIARQLAGALEAAHEQGIIHRDLKPANIKVRPDGSVKVLDFGLAKLAAPTVVAGNAGASMSPTITSPALMTGVGVLLGTAAYMSPEQAKGGEANKRSDIWAFGCVLFEMLTGKRAFEGEDIGETLAAVIKTEPDLSRAPREVRRLLRSCLAKQPAERLRAIADAWLLVDEHSALPVRERSRPIGWIAATALFAALAVVAAAWAVVGRRSPPAAPLVRLEVRPSPDATATATGFLAISPDGRRTVFAVRGADGTQRLAVRRLDQDTATTISGSEDGGEAFFSPDGQWLGFVTPTALKKVSVEGGAPVIVAESLTPRGATWLNDGTIVASLRNAGGLVRIPESGGTPMELTRLEPGETTHRWPYAIPGHDVVLYTTSSDSISYDGASIKALSLKTGVSTTVVRDGYFGRYLAGERAGYLLFLRDQTLFAVLLDPESMEARGTPFPVFDGVARARSSGFGYFDVSQTGTFVYARSAALDPGWVASWLESSGKTEALITAPGTYDMPRISPDGGRLALAKRSGRATDLFIHDVARDTMSRLTFIGGRSPVWTPDGRHLAFAAGTQGRDASETRFGIYWIRADGSGQPELLLPWKYQVNPYSFSPDSRYLTLFENTPDAGTNILMLPLDMSDAEHPKAGKPEPFLETSFNELEASFSPDGRWIAYRANESGMMELYVRPFRGSGKWQISAGGVMHPRWSPAGRQLFYETLDGHIMVVDYSVDGDSFVTGKPRLWTADRILAPSGGFNMDVAPDGKRLVVFPRPPSDDESLSHVTFLFNFGDEIARRAPAASAK